MSRQLRTLIIGAILVVVLGAATFGLRVPYVVLSPGPTINTLGKDNGTPIIAVEGHKTTPTSGKLNLTTVSVDTQNTTVAGAIRGWLKSDQVVVPHDSVFPPGQTPQQTNEQDKQDFIQSQDSAIAAASCELKYPRGVRVTSVQTDSPNLAVLKAGDTFVSLGGVSVSDDTGLVAVLQKHKAGDTVEAVINRAGKQLTVPLHLAAPTSPEKPPRLGIALTTGCLAPFQINLGLSGIGGPSAGLMFALGIVDTLGTDDLTHGKVIAGTGEIDADGNVGQIGGIQLKMLGARRDGATVFLAPASNCADVRGNVPAGLNVIKVTTLDDAITSLDAVNSGSGPLPRC